MGDGDESALVDRGARTRIGTTFLNVLLVCDR
jgi:hypothetical protein